jgi:hypothetical protein
MGGSKTTTTNTIDPRLMALYQQNYDTALGVANRPFQPYTGEGVAPFSPAQLEAQGILGDLGRSNTGDNALSGAVNGVTGILGRVGANAPTLSGTDLSPYTNPFQRNVIGATLNELDQQRGRQRVADDQAATAANAFGGDRQGVADALTNEAFDRNTAATLANLNAQNFGQAQSAAEFDLNRGLTADQLGLGASRDLANLSNDQLTLAASRAGILGSVGAQQQAHQQALDQFDYQQFLNQFNYPLEQQNIRNAALGLIPLQQTQTTRQSQSGLGGILGPIGNVVGSILTTVPFG